MLRRLRWLVLCHRLASVGVSQARHFQLAGPQKSPGTPIVSIRSLARRLLVCRFTRTTPCASNYRSFFSLLSLLAVTADTLALRSSRRNRVWFRFWWRSTTRSRTSPGRTCRFALLRPIRSGQGALVRVLTLIGSSLIRTAACGSTSICSQMRKLVSSVTFAGSIPIA